MTKDGRGVFMMNGKLILAARRRRAKLPDLPKMDDEECQNEAAFSDTGPVYMAADESELEW